MSTTAPAGTGPATEEIAVITGAGRGLGRSTAEHLLARGTRVIGTYRSDEAAARSLVEAHGADRVEVLRLDTARTAEYPAFVDAVRAAAARFGRDRVDYLVDNAGTALHASFAETTEEQFDEVLAVHLRAPYFLTQAMLPVLADGGRVLNVSSGLAHFVVPGSSAYAVMKAGVEVMSRYQAVELGERRIRVNTVVPGAIATDFSGGMVRDDPGVNAAVAASIPLGRVGRPEDVGGAVALLLDDAFGWANGATVELTGGQRL
ncbi:SDR family NAD(P)-dependent oxidoreductase [uncultured Pseudokineococcus sp.]|uniref:SDR family NAD(P)-dependent oxidoreductase n=1 Tax=uncultured Pseudokineococcus sp. TaxID=1642928 RepID=UPI00261BC564|nr:SDR family oxidoreductase [uncultured Pseudokineococcus sp.]